jgi:hypothetical protein
MTLTRLLIAMLTIGIAFVVAGLVRSQWLGEDSKSLAERCSEMGGEWLYRSADLLCLMPGGEKFAYNLSQDTFVTFPLRSGTVENIQVIEDVKRDPQSCLPAPRFEDYQSNQSFAGKARVDFATNEAALHYRTAIKKDVAAGVNFAGKYVMSTWGCGQSCKGAAVINADTGKILTYGLQADKFVFQNDSDLVQVGKDQYFVIEQDALVAWCTVSEGLD